tara:strand:+ start:303 stop:701 length:399 start_codon:yes stop_codon:yes gene_type:complete
MSTKVSTVSPKDSIGTLQKMLGELEFHQLLLEEDGKLIGIVTDRDMLANFSPFVGGESQREQDLDQQEMLVSEIMTKVPVTVDRSTSVDVASIMLLEHGIACLPMICDDDVIEGIMTWKDILKVHVYESAYG